MSVAGAATDQDVVAKPFRFSIRTMLIAFAVTGVLLWLLRQANRVYQVPWDAYAGWNGALLIIDHLEHSDGEWPKGWNDLETALNKRNGRTVIGQSIAEIRERIDIDFQADPLELAQRSATSQPPFTVVWLRNGRDTFWEHREPNMLIYQYLTNPTEFMKSGAYLR